MTSLTKALSNLSLVKQQSASDNAKAYAGVLAALKPILDDNVTLLNAIEKLKYSKEYYLTEDNCVAKWVRLDHKDVRPADMMDEALFIEALDDYLHERDYLHYNRDSKVLEEGVGPSVIWDVDGNVYDQDSGKIVVNRNDYSSKEECFVLIEKWMETNGYFPNVFSCDNFDNLKLLNTKSE